ncbi:MAG: PorV/PorQ family protein [Candidatus Marinimicrobia bacterium]|jgi:hypothetical protein|nr:PorV/PorQ family protein [Candidatus Neomarinimicrobiota bacterium]MBT4361167.1 PorV/PorQ family protein [Candidatus Neomarinimicrobiota bacterium]MBT4715189.1 PorV/PorQ family protein [Candidatus Neomarinimicrobiota bacterium]MBT4947363.1 PorV/PorQ family protein [Candidatus Neomarinimicrobiota bacterium]MBT5271448.1 PorV/PorQ family protein [Candidatus Neomarinimicrobiota bacterium]
MIRKQIFLILIWVLFLFAQYDRPGSTSAQFLKIDISARGAGMAGAYNAAVEGAEGLVYNPAVIANLEKVDAVFNHNVWFAGINHDYMAIAKNFGMLGAFGLSVTTLYTPEMKVRTPLQPDGTGETFFAGNVRAGLSYARRLTDHVSFGGTLNYIYLSLYSDFSERGYTIDISTDYNTGIRDWRLAFAILNFGQSLTFVNEEYPMPTLFTIGSSVNAIERENLKLKLSGTLKKPNDGAPLGQGGAELNLSDILFLRAGTNFGHQVARFAFGGGLAYTFASGMGFRFDYSYSDFNDLGGAHRYALGIGF